MLYSQNEDRKDVTEEWRRTMRHDFVKGVKYKSVSCKWTKQQKIEDM